MARVSVKWAPAEERPRQREQTGQSLPAAVGLGVSEGYRGGP